MASTLSTLFTWSILSFNPELSRAAHKKSSLCFLKGSKLVRISPLKRKGVWGITDNRCLSVCNPSERAERLSIWYSEPNSGSMILKRAWIIEDFPAPVLPTIPTFYPSSILKEIFFKTKGSYGRYRREKFFTIIEAFLGQLSCIPVFSMVFMALI